MTLKAETRLSVVQAALDYETAYMNRKTMIKAIKTRLRVLGREQMRAGAEAARDINGEAA